MYGETLSKLRVKKGLSSKNVATGIMSSSQLSKIEKDKQSITAETFIRLLFRMNCEFDEFLMFSDDEYFKTRTKTKNNIKEILRSGNPMQLKAFIKLMDEKYKEYHDEYFKHMKCILRAKYVMIVSNNDYALIRAEITPIIEYLDNVNSWFHYEISLLNNTLFYYDHETAIKLGNEAITAIEGRFNEFKDNELTRSLLINLAIYALKK